MSAREHPANLHRKTPLSQWERRGWLLQTVAQTDVGSCRACNEDDYEIAPELGLYVVGDGLGGSYSTAALMMTDEVMAFFQELPDVQQNGLLEGNCEGPCRGGQWLREALLRAHRAIQRRQREDLVWQGHGACALVLFVCCDQVHIAHIGDVRAYRWREGQLQALTEDHNLIHFLRRGGYALEEIDEYKQYSNIVIRCLGHGDMEADVTSEVLREGDLYLVCTDGLHRKLDDSWITQLLATSDSLQTACERLVTYEQDDAQNTDNITVLLLHVAQDRRSAEQQLASWRQTWEEPLFEEG